MSDWFIVGGDSKNRGDPFSATVPGGSPLPMPPPQEEPQYMVDLGVAGAKTVTATADSELVAPYLNAPDVKSFWDDPENVASVYNYAQLHPEVRNDPTFDWDGLNSIWSDLSNRNRGKQYYAWDGYKKDDPQYGLLRSLQIPSFIASDPNYQKKYDAQGNLIPVTYTPDAALQTTQDVSDLSPSKMSPLEQGIMEALPTVGKAVGTAGMAFQGAGVAGLPGAVVGGVAGLGMSSADPTKDAFFDRVFSKANEWLNIGSENVEGFLGYMFAGSAPNVPDIENMSRRDMMAELYKAKQAGYDAPGDLLVKMLTGTAEEKAAAKKEWETNIQAGRVFYNAALSQGYASVPGKILAGLSTHAADRTEDETTADVIAAAINDALDRKDEIWGFEGADGWQPPEDTPALRAAFNDAKALIESGVAPREAVAQVEQRFGVGGVLADLMGNAILDPLNLVGVGLLKVAGLAGKAAKGLKALETVSDAGRFVSKAASKLSLGVVDDLASPAFDRALRESSDVVQLSRNMGAEVRASGAQNAARASFFTRALAGVDAKGNYRRFMPPASSDSLNAFQKIGNALTLGTKESRAAQMLSHIRQGLANQISSMDNADDVVRVLDQVSSMSPADAVKAAESGSLAGWMDNVMSQSAPAAIRDTLPAVRSLAGLYQDSRKNATLLARMAEASGKKNVREFVNDIMRRSDDEVESLWRVLKEKGFDKDLTSGPALRQVAQPFYGAKAIPLTLDEFKAHTINALSTGTGKFAATYFGVKPEGWVWQAFNTAKKLQGFLLLGVNPSYLFNNAINNSITLAYDGLFNIGALIGADKFFARWGDPVFKAKYGAALDVASDTPGDKEIRKAMRAKGLLSKVSNAADAVNRSKFAFASNLSQKVEEASSRMAMVVALRDTMDRVWRPGVGFDDLDASLARSLDAVQPGLSAKVRNGIRNGLTKAEIEKNIFGDIDRLTLRDVLADDEMYNGLSQVPGLTDFLDDRLSRAKTPQDLLDSFTEARGHLDDWAAQAATEAAQEWAEHAATVVKAEGAHAVLASLDDMSDDLKDRHISHFQAMDAAAQAARDMPDPNLRGAIWHNARKASQKAWDNFRTMQKAKMVGLARGLGANDTTVLALTEAMDVQARVWDDYFDRVDKAYQAHGNSRFTTPEAESRAWERMQAQLDKAYRTSRRQELAVRDQLDNLFADMFEKQFPGKRDAALSWRKEVARVEDMQYQSMAYFRGAEAGDALPVEARAKINSILGGMELNEMTGEGRTAAWQAFISEVYEPLIVEKSVKARQANQQMLAEASKPRVASPEEIDAVRRARVQARQDEADLADLDSEISALQQYIAERQNSAQAPRPPVDEAFESKIAGLREQLDELDDLLYSSRDDIGAGEIANQKSRVQNELDRLMRERQADLPRAGLAEDAADADLISAQQRLIELMAERQAYQNAPPPPGGQFSLTPEQQRGEVFRILSQVEDYFMGRNGAQLPEAKTQELMRRSASKYLGRKVSDLADITPEEAQLVIQRRLAAKELGLKGKAVHARLAEIERQLGIDMGDVGGPDPVAVNSPLDLVEKMRPMPPYKEAIQQGLGNLRASLDKARNTALTTPRGMFADAMRKAPEDVKAGLSSYLSKVYDQLTESKNTATRVAEGRRNFALLDYNDRYGFDNYLGAIMPYQFWYTRSMTNWAARVLTRPEILHRYAQLATVGQSVPQEDLPKRLWGKLKLPIAFADEGDIYIDPLRQVFPFLQVWKGMNQFSEDKNMLKARTEDILRQKMEEGEVTATALQAALEDVNSDLYKEAQAEAQTQLDLDIRNPVDFISSMAGLSLPANVIYQMAMGTPERISTLPITKTLQNASYALQRVIPGSKVTQGWQGPEAVLRKGVGAPPDRYNDIYLDRALAAMSSDAEAAGGKIKGPDGKEMVVTADDFRRAMIDRSGPLYDLAQRRVSDMGLAKYLGSSLGLDVYQRGEERQRAIRNEYRMGMATDDPDAYKKFSEAFPEYKVQQDAWKPTDQRLRAYLKDSVWTAYYSLPRAKQQDFRDQIGEEFTQLFLNSETRNYDAIPTEKLAQWVKTMGGEVPESAGMVAGAPMKWSDPKVVESLGQYYESRDQQFPGLTEYLDSIKYYDLPEEEQNKVLLDKPEISQYNVWRNGYLAAHPEIIQRVISPKSIVYGKPLEVQAAYYNKKAMADQYFPNIAQAQAQYFALPEKSAARRAFLNANPALRQYWSWSESYDKQYSPLSLQWMGESKQMKLMGVTPPAYRPNEVVDDMSDELMGRLTEYFVYRRALTPAARSELEILRRKYAKGETLDGFLATLQAEIMSSQN